MKALSKPPFREFFAKFSSEYGDFKKDAGSRFYLRDYGVFRKKTNAVSVRFDNIEAYLGELISNSEIALGAIAWLTNRALLEQLATLKKVSIVVQKEDFLRIDDRTENRDSLANRLNMQYSNLNPLDMGDFPESYPGQQDGMPDHNSNIDSWLITADGQYIQSPDPIRCLGYSSGNSGLPTPKMHHKFMVFGDFSPDIVIRPTCVVTGSFNWSQNAVASRENIVTIYDPEICRSYISEWAQLWALSEPLNWTSDQPVFPSHYIGT